ncbi:MAG: Stk1 family PASTA domain-containing Ser/Thr kinase, partial [Oscillospiraceae bacterium]|nr:Stk1 family PASTA domain-containing Ser/Thr kinase [Oscillospiraceae bacterium]
KARDHRLNRLVAVKILKPELANDAEFRRRFHDESRAVAMLSNANIVSVYDVSHSDGLNYIVMELIDGMTLKQYMKKRGTPLNWREALHFITQIMRALSHAHSRGIIHRDIKPHNIMILRDGSVKVTDFGIAQLASAAQNTLTQEAIGSVHYISPEQAKGSHVDCRTDIYSAGVVLYEMLTGRLPFEGDTPVGVAIQHINAIPIPPRSLNPDVPKALEDITMKAMSPTLEQRYGTADEMLEDLKEFRKNPDMEVSRPVSQADILDEPTMVVPVSRMGRTGDIGWRQRPTQEPERRDRRHLDPEDDDDYDEPPRRGGGIVPALVAILVILLFIGGMLFFLYNFLLKGMFEDTKQYPVPSILGYTLEDLKRDKTILGEFTVETVDTVFSEEYAEGKICEQIPVAGSMAREGDLVIKVNISGGEDKMYMEDVAGWDARQALQVLQNEMGLDVTVEEDYSDTITQGYVIRYTPIKGKLLEKGDEVTIVISKGPEVPQVTVPSFINSKFDDVERQLSSLGLTRNKVDYYPSDEYAEGRVIWQSIEVNKEVDKGTAIDYRVSSGPVYYTHLRAHQPSLHRVSRQLGEKKNPQTQ